VFDPVHVKLCRYIYVEQVLQTELLFKAIDVLPYTFSFVLLNVGNMANQIESYCIVLHFASYCIVLHLLALRFGNFNFHFVFDMLFRL